MLLAFDGITIGEKWTTVLPSKVDVDFFYSGSNFVLSRVLVIKSWNEGSVFI